MSKQVPLVQCKSSKLVIMSDIHIGAEDHCEREFDEALEWIIDNRALVLLNGDIIENAIVSGKSPGEKLLSQSSWPTEQFKVALDKFKRLSRKNLIVGITRGNHDARTRRESLLDVCDILAHALKVPYLGVGGIVRFNFKGQVFPIALHHGRSGGKNIWLELDKLSNLYPTAKLVALGHNHALDARKIAHLTTDKFGSETLGYRWQVRTGSFLGYADYVREMACAPSFIGCPIITFFKDGDIDVDVDTLSWSNT